MFSLLISVMVSIAVVVSLGGLQVKTGTSVFFGITAFVVSHLVIGLLVRRKIKSVQGELEGIMKNGQQRMNRKIQQAQTRPGTNVKLLQRQLEGDQKQIIKEALSFTDRMEPFRKWSLLMGRQIATMRLQFLYQLKEFDEVDRIFSTRGLFKGPMMMEPITVAMKMARQYKHGDSAGAEKTFRKKIKWFRNDRGVLLYGLLSWIYVKNGEAEKARELLQKGKEKTGDETLAYNWERLSNNKEKSFSNEGLGEQWYGLYLENPPAPKQQRVRAQKGRRPF